MPLNIVNFMLYKSLPKQISILSLNSARSHCFPFFPTPINYFLLHSLHSHCFIQQTTPFRSIPLFLIVFHFFPFHVCNLSTKKQRPKWCKCHSLRPLRLFIELSHLKNFPPILLGVLSGLPYRHLSNKLYVSRGEQKKEYAIPDPELIWARFGETSRGTTSKILD